MIDLTEVKTADLAGEALGWAVGKAEGLYLQLAPPGYNGVPWRVFARYRGQAIEHTKRYNPWEDWALGGSLIEKHCFGAQWNSHLSSCQYCYRSGPATSVAWLHGSHPLIHFCKSLVELKLGLSIEIPTVLTE